MAQQEMDRRTELLEKCFELFCENGLENSGIKKVVFLKPLRAAV